MKTKPLLASAEGILRRRGCLSVTVTELADAVEMSLTRFSDEFKSENAVTPKSWLVAKKKEFVIEQVKVSRPKALTLANLIGITHESNFSRWCLQTFGKRYEEICAEYNEKDIAAAPEKSTGGEKDISKFR